MRYYFAALAMTGFMIKKILEKIKNIPKFWWIFLAILVVGIFLRTWQHHDWLRFNADQGRDAQIVSGVVEGTAAWPLLGPKAGGTQFRLGPIFYYFQIGAAKIFGNAPNKMAYPDLLAGILTIPLFFFFLRKYFEKRTSLFLTAIFAVSAYAVFYARFAWNPNSTPFWTLLYLYAIHEIVSEKSKRKFFWAVLAGVALGIDVQLHTTLLVILPVVAVLVFGYLAFKNFKTLKYFLVIMIVSLLLNTPQLISMHQKNGRNMKLFFRGLKIKQQAENSVSGKVLQSGSCWVQGSLEIVSGYEISDTCAFKPSRSIRETAIFFLGLIFSLGGTILGVRYFFKEKDADRKTFLGIIFIFVGAAYLVFLKMAFELSVRFYLPLVFFPFFLLGFWIRFFNEKFKVNLNAILLAASVPLIMMNLYFVLGSFSTLANGGTIDVTTLREAEEFSKFIVENSKNEKKVYIVGDDQFLHKAYTPIKYLTGKSNIKLTLVRKNSPLPGQYFQVANPNRKSILLGDKNFNVLGEKQYGKFSILLIENKVSN
jgi:4-amino-4-deoxy-L-arabinose transferase-like glycosyltransferase